MRRIGIIYISLLLYLINNVTSLDYCEAESSKTIKEQLTDCKLGLATLKTRLATTEYNLAAIEESTTNSPINSEVNFIKKVFRLEQKFFLAAYGTVIPGFKHVSSVEFAALFNEYKQFYDENKGISIYEPFKSTFCWISFSDRKYMKLDDLNLDAGNYGENLKNCNERVMSKNQCLCPRGSSPNNCLDSSEKFGVLSFHSDSSNTAKTGALCIYARNDLIYN